MCSQTMPATVNVKGTLPRVVTVHPVAYDALTDNSMGEIQIQRDDVRNKFHPNHRFNIDYDDNGVHIHVCTYTRIG